MQRSTPEKNARHIYTWNPDLETFKSLPLQDKIMMFNQTVLWCQTHFQDNNKIDEPAICLIIAPEFIFTGADGNIYTHEDNEDLKYRISFLQMALESRVLVIAGTIQHLTETQDAYKNTAYVISRSAIRSYSKKESSGDIIHAGKSIPLAKGQQSGVFEFNGLLVGLEVCQDHNAGCLMQEVGEGGVDVHVLISNGQNIRSHHIAANARRNGSFIVCELEPGRVIDESKTSELTTCYSLRTSSSSTDKHRQAYFDKLHNSITTELVAEDQTLLGNISLSVCNSASTPRAQHLKHSSPTL